MELTEIRKSKAEKNMLLLIPLDCQWQPKSMQQIFIINSYLAMIKKVYKQTPFLEKICRQDFLSDANNCGWRDFKIDKNGI